MLMLSVLLLIIAIVMGIYAFGLASTPYVGTFRILFYFFVIFFVVTVVVGLMQPSYYGGYDPTPAR
jgi:uncharacterized membrane protein YtjA (UPF0391 family)